MAVRKSKEKTLQFTGTIEEAKKSKIKKLGKPTLTQMVPG